MVDVEEKDSIYFTYIRYKNRHKSQKKSALKEKEIKVSVEILKKIKGHVIKNYLYLKNVKVF